MSAGINSLSKPVLQPAKPRAKVRSIHDNGQGNRKYLMRQIPMIMEGNHVAPER